MSNIIFSCIKIALKFLNFLSPKLAAKAAIELSSYPRRRAVRDFESSAYDTAECSVMIYKDYEIELYKWGTGAKKLLLVHGWEGHAGHFSKIIERLDKKAWTAYSFDAPAHGYSTGKRADNFDFSCMLGAYLDDRSFDAMICHSFGCVAAAFALGAKPEIKIPNCIMIAPPDTFRGRVKQIQNFLGLSEKTADHVLEYYCKLLNMEIDDLSVSYFAPLSSIQTATIITDINDKVSPFKWSKSIHNSWQISELIPVKDKGHYKILFDDEVIALILKKLDVSEF